MPMLKTVCVYCASSERTPERYLDSARYLGAALADGGLTTLYGGGAVGMMGALADAALAAGGRVVGVRPEFISELERPHPGASEMIFTDTMHQRKQIFLERADAFVALPGAIGTLDELIETITWRRLGLHNRAICALNVHGFFDPLKQQFGRMVTEGLVAEEFLTLTAFLPDAAAVMDHLRSYTPAPAAPVMWPDD
jgi:uncharacterized protein (TIGR00730 family)